MNRRIRRVAGKLLRASIATALGLGLASAMIASATTLADQPVFSTSSVPGNLALSLSVEYPTVSRVAHVADYSSASSFLGYFDPEKCYVYVPDATPNGVLTDTTLGDSSYFKPVGRTTNRTCSGQWSGNFLNWATLTAIDPFRWAMTGGRRVVDTATETIIEKGRNAGQGYFPTRDQTARTEGRIPLNQVAGATPFSTATALSVEINGRGFAMRLGVSGAVTRTMTAYYYNNTTFSGSPVVRNNDSASHDWGTSRPTTGINADNFSARFEGTFTAPETGSYVFRTNSDDGVRVWVSTNGGTFTACGTAGGNCVINNWIDHGPTLDDSVAIPMTAGQTFSVRVDYYESAGGAVMQLMWRKPSSGSFTTFSDDSGTNDYTVRVKVCDPSAAAGGLEGNCKAYGSNYKPEGLIQQYADKMRYSAFGYLNDDNEYRDGAVLRARQKFVGPTYPVPGQVPAINGGREWDATTGVFLRNPDPTDATNTTAATVQDSGVMNYLNKFGQLMPGTYKAIDPVNELFYAALRYYRNLGNVPAWSDMSGASDAATRTKWVDGFPVITNWGDPIQYSCQRNFVLGIGDIYTHRDKNVPGNTLTDHEPTMPAEVRADFTNNAAVADAIASTNKVKSLQGLGENRATAATGSAYSTDYMAGMAYYANTKDIRSDLTGKQTVQTYWVDVLEAPFVANNKFYMAAKFGGLNQKKLPLTFNPDTATAASILDDWWTTSGDLLPGNVKRPDNYFTAGRPDTMVAGLKQAFERISGDIDAYTTSFSLSSVDAQASGVASYGAQYDSKDWTGIVTATQITFDAQGNPAPGGATLWSTSTTLPAQLNGTGWNTNRRIATWNGSLGVPFRLDSLSTAQANALNTSYGGGSDRSNYLDYLRGDRSMEKTDGDGSKPYRKRALLLGDVVNSKVTPVGPPSKSFSESINPGYTTFKSGKATRPTMVYVGANDGMLHAFDGSTGTEQFAYVPSAVINGPSGTPQTDGLAQLGSPNYQHRYYVDATPKVFDVDFNHAGGTFTTTNVATSDWRSILIGGLGKGGRSFYAIDVSAPNTITTEAIAAGKVLWEFTDPTMGFSFGAPNVVKTKKYGWVVVLTSGYNNDGGGGNGYLYFVNPRNGALLEKVSTGSASNGLAHASAYVQDFSDNTADAFYAGDLDGQLWRFDVTAARGTSTPYPSATKLVQASDGSATPVAQPITTPPLIEIQPQTRKRFVMFGTGQLLDAVDIGSTRAQSFYSVLDGTISGFRPVDETMPVTRSQLTQVTNLTTGVTLSASSRGWYIDLGNDAATGVGWRMVTNPATFSGIVSFAPMLTTADACSPSGRSRLYSVDLATGRSVLTGIGYSEYTSTITDIKFVNIDGSVRQITGTNNADRKKEPFELPAGLGVRLLNWREVPTVD
jgi:type IV pilus assembly protein PilY1